MSRLAIRCPASNWMSRRMSGAGEASSSQTLCAVTSTSTLATQTKFTVACIMCLCVCVRAVNMGSRTWKGSSIIFYCLLLFSLAWENSCKDNKPEILLHFLQISEFMLRLMYFLMCHYLDYFIAYNYPCARMQIMIQ